MKIERLLQIVFILLNTDKISAQKLANRFGVSKRTIYRDIESLSLAKIPIYTSLGKNGGISLIPGYKIDSALFSNQEKQQIIESVESLSSISGEKNEQLQLKLKAIFNEKTTPWLSVDFSPWSNTNQQSLKFETIKFAIINKEELTIEYFASYKGLTKRVIKPIQLIFKSQNWYLYSFCTYKMDYRLFKLKRITNIYRTGRSFFNDTFELPKKRVENTKAKEINLKLKFSPSIAFRAFDEFLHTDITINEDNSIFLNTRIIYDGWIISFLASLGNQVEIVEPKYLEEEVLTFIKKIETKFK